jgi:uncharacterized membrane protein YgdD (TMEM256/DUF423 family)
MPASRLKAAAAALAAASILFGAFGAHAAASEQAAQWLRTGTSYLLPHCVAAIALASYRRIAWALLAGAVVFAFTLYAMALGAPRWLGAVTPVGGALMICAWLSLAWQTFKQSHD